MSYKGHSTCSKACESICDLLVLVDRLRFDRRKMDYILEAICGRRLIDSSPKSTSDPLGVPSAQDRTTGVHGGERGGVSALPDVLFLF